LNLTKKIIVIVDAISSGEHYVSAFIGHGYQCVHIGFDVGPFNTAKIAEGKDYVENIVATDDNLEYIVARLKKYDIKAVVAGSERGVPLADKIADRFSVKKNPVSSSLNRRNKFLIIEALSKANVPCAKQYCSADLDELIEWYQNAASKKVVFKPTLSALSESVYICENVSDIERAYSETKGKENILGIVNADFVLQEYLDGKEYIVNSVSNDGEHFITDIWVGVGGIENRISTDQYAETITKEDPEFDILSQYVKKVLDAVEIKNGPAHSEIKMTLQGPKLIEVGARLAGSLHFAVLEEVNHYSQLSLAIETYLSPDLFKDKIEIYKKLPQKKIRFVYFCSYIEGIVIKKPDLKFIFQLPSVQTVSFYLQKGDRLHKTNEVVGRPGYAFLVGDQKVVEEDYLRLRQLERELYETITQPDHINE